MNKDSTQTRATSKSPLAFLRVNDLRYVTDDSEEVSDKPIFHPEGDSNHGVGFDITRGSPSLPGQNHEPVVRHTSPSIALQNLDKPRYQSASHRKSPKSIELLQTVLEKPM